MKRIVLWALSTTSAVVLLFSYSTSTQGPLATSASTSAVSGSTAGAATTSGTSSGTGSSSGTSSGTGSTTATTTLTGEVAQTRWGPVQVELSMDGDTITDVTVLQQPSGNPRDTEINAQALPVLVQETLDAQGADIDAVSGATVTSDGYLQSLQSALDQA